MATILVIDSLLTGSGTFKFNLKTYLRGVLVKTIMDTSNHSLTIPYQEYSCSIIFCIYKIPTFQYNYYLLTGTTVKTNENNINKNVTIDNDMRVSHLATFITGLGCFPVDLFSLLLPAPVP